MTLLYYPEVFTVSNIERAKSIILTSEGPGAETEIRWERETPYVLELISHVIALRPGMVVLDYGCGIGRLAKAMIDASGCSVIGVDISSAMLALAQDYVDSDRFVGLLPQQFDVLVRAGLQTDAFISVWVLQHCFAPADDIARIRSGLRAASQGFVLNLSQRAVPAMAENPTVADGFTWAPDPIDIASLLRDAFVVTGEGSPDLTRAPEMGGCGTFWMGLAI